MVYLNLGIQVKINMEEGKVLYKDKNSLEKLKIMKQSSSYDNGSNWEIDNNNSISGKFDSDYFQSWNKNFCWYYK